MGVTNITVGVRGKLKGLYPNSATEGLGPHDSIRAGTLPYRASGAEVDRALNQFLANPSPIGLNFYAKVQPRRNVKTIPNSSPPSIGLPFTNFIAKPYALNPVIQAAMKGAT